VDKFKSAFRNGVMMQTKPASEFFNKKWLDPNFREACRELDQQDADIDRAMQWCEEYLRELEINVPLTSFNLEAFFDAHFDTCVRYLEKVEAGL
jgi:hypothetical protein